MSCTQEYKGVKYTGQPFNLIALYAGMIIDMDYKAAKIFVQKEIKEEKVKLFRNMTWAILYVVHNRKKELKKMDAFYQEHKEAIDFLIKCAKAKKARDEAYVKRYNENQRNPTRNNSEFLHMRAEYPSAPNHVSINGVNYTRDGSSYDYR